MPIYSSALCPCYKAARTLAVGEFIRKRGRKAGPAVAARPRL